MTKHCKQCNKELKRKNDEWPYLFKKRIFCNKKCEGLFRKGKKRPNTGKKISKALKGIKRSDEYKKQCEKRATGVKQSTKTIAKRVAKNIGKKRTKEQRMKIADAQRGEKGYWWKGGVSNDLYSVDWTETLRRSIRERDKYTCQICNKQQGDRAFCVHHVDYNKLNNDPNNLITLCNSCHSKTNSDRDYWMKYFEELVMDSLEI